MATTVREHEESLDRAEEFVHESRQAWVGAERTCTVLRRLEERQRDRWQLDADRAAASELDEVATVRFRSGSAAP